MLTEIDPFASAVIVTDQPSPGGDGPAGALDGPIGRKLADLAGIEPADLYAMTERYNLIELPATSTWQQDAIAAGMLAKRLQGRRVFMVGAAVAGGFESVLSASVPKFAALRHAGIELVRLPDLIDITVSLDEAMVIGKIIRAEVERRRAVLGSWCSMRLGASGYGDPPQDVIYHPATGTFAADKANFPTGWQVDDRCAHDPNFAGLSDGQATALLDYLCAAAGRVPRWQASVPCYVGPHCIDVAGRTAQLARQRGWLEPAIKRAVQFAGMHDLHECLPAIGDAPGPVVRMLRRTSPAWRLLDDRARAALAALYDVDDCGSDIEALVKQADLDCRALERALFFGDAPAWLGPRGKTLAEFALAAYTGSSSALRGIRPEHLYNYDPRVLYDAVRFGTIPDFCPFVALLPEDLLT